MLRRNLLRHKDELTMLEVAHLVVPEIDLLFPSHISVISEPGRYFVEGAVELYLKVFEIAKLETGSVVPGVVSELNNKDTNSSEQIMLCFVNEGPMGCFKDLVLSDVKFEPNLVPDDQGIM